MAKHTTRWSPDTCSCVLEYEWDDNDPPETRAHDLKTYVNRCPEHTVLPDVIASYNTVKNENSRKNVTLQTMLENGPAALYDVNADGARTLKGNITYSWTWTGVGDSRVMNVTLTGITLTTNQRNTIQTVLNNIFGTGKVILT